MKASTTPSRLLLVADQRPGAGHGQPAVVRRFRLARLRVAERPAAAAAKHSVAV